MSRDAIWLLALLAVVGLVVAYQASPGPPPPPPVVTPTPALTAAPLSVGGVRLGMSKSQVIAQLGPPSSRSRGKRYWPQKLGPGQQYLPFAQGRAYVDIVLSRDDRVVWACGFPLEQEGRLIADPEGTFSAVHGVQRLEEDGSARYWPAYRLRLEGQSEVTLANPTMVNFQRPLSVVQPCFVSKP